MAKLWNYAFGVDAVVGLNRRRWTTRLARVDK